MATTTVITAFNKFQSEMGNLDPQKPESPTPNKYWRIEPIYKSTDKGGYFPKLYADINIQFGSLRLVKLRKN